MPPKVVKTPLNATAKVAETAADVLDASAGLLRQAAGGNAEQTIARVADQVEEQVEQLREVGDESQSSAPKAKAEPLPHHGEDPAPGTRTFANVGNPKAAKKLRKRENAR